MRIAKGSRAGITRGDVVAMLAVATLLLIVGLPTLNQLRIRAQRTTCQEHQRRLTYAVLRYESDHGHFPGYRNLQAVGADGARQPTGWVFPLLRYLAEQPKTPGGGEKSTNEPPPVDPNDPRVQIFAAHGTGGPDETRGLVPQVFIAGLLCPSDAREVGDDIDPQSTSTSYVVNTGLPDERRRALGLEKHQMDGVFFDRFADGDFPDVSASLLRKRGQLDSTLLLSENVDAGQWTDYDEPLVGFVWLPQTAPGEAPSDDVLLPINRQRGQGDGTYRFARPSSLHTGGVNVIYCDGHGDFLYEEIDYSVFCRLMSPDDSLIDR